MAVYLVSVVLFSAIVSPWVFRACQFFGSQGEPFHGWQGAEFHEVMNRVLLLSALVGAIILLVVHKTMTLQTVGFASSPIAFRHLVLGMSVAVLSVAVVTWVGFSTGTIEWDGSHSRQQDLRFAIGSLIAAAVVAVSEEFFFRGCLLGWLRQRTHAWTALAAVTLFYAICHFMNPPRDYPAETDVNALSGFIMLGQYFLRLIQDAAWLPRFAMLVLVGLTLGWCFLKTSRVYLSIGLHAGWVFAGKMMIFLTDVKKSESNWWFGYGKTIGSPITILVVACVFALMIWICSQPKIRGGSETA